MDLEQFKDFLGSNPKAYSIESLLGFVDQIKEKGRR